MINIKKYTEEEILDIHTLATIRAKEASQSLSESFTETYGHADIGSCGFAWVEISDLRANTKVAKMLFNLGFTRKGYGKPALVLWNPSESPVQNIDIKEVGANAYAEVLREYGFNAHAISRLD